MPVQKSTPCASIRQQHESDMLFATTSNRIINKQIGIRHEKNPFTAPHHHRPDPPAGNLLPASHRLGTAPGKEVPGVGSSGGLAHQRGRNVCHHENHNEGKPAESREDGSHRQGRSVQGMAPDTGQLHSHHQRHGATPHSAAVRREARHDGSDPRHLIYI